MMKNESENSALLPSEGSTSKPTQGSPWRSKALWGATTVALVAVAAVLGTVAVIGQSESSSPTKPLAARSFSSTELSTDGSINDRFGAAIAVHSDVYSFDEMKKTRFSYPGLNLELIAEPQRETTFTIDFDEILRSAIAEGDPDLCSYGIHSTQYGKSVQTPWDLINGVTPQSEFKDENGYFKDVTTSKKSAYSAAFKSTLPSPGAYKLSVSCPAAVDKQSDVEFTANVACFYIRRELRELTPQMRDDFLNAFLVMDSLSTEEGQLKYGGAFVSLKSFEMMHLIGAGERRVDHFHDGMGITTQHTAMTAAFELAMQSVNPAVFIPYWDYTIDRTKIKATTPMQFSDIFHESELFTSDWFGKTDGKEHRVTEGRFADQEVEQDFTAAVHSPYGFLRAPWNINPSRYVTRYHKYCGASPSEPSVERELFGRPTVDQALEMFPWPSCESHYMMTNTDAYDTWKAWNIEVGLKPHGPVHGWIGGVGGQCTSGLWDEMKDKGWISEIQLQWMKHNSFIMLKNLWRGYLIEMPKFCEQGTPVSECMWTCVDNIADHPKVQSFVLSLFKIGKETEHYSEIVTRALCETPFWPGDHLEAASPVEASFWPIHPTLDRLVQYKSTVNPWKDMAWASIPSNATCGSSDSGCKGHNAWDATNFQAVLKNLDDGNFEVKYSTNIEIRDAVTPQEGLYKMSYLYNHFEWNHCAETGVSFMKVEDTAGI